MTQANRTRKSHLFLIALLGVLLVGLFPAPAQAYIDSSAESQFVNLINQERTSRGLGKLAVRSDLVKVARAHSVDMANQNHLHHNPDLGSDVTNWLRLTENVGVGPSVKSLHEAFMNSSGHRANILDSKVTEIGVGVEVRGSKIWVTEIFRLPQNSTTSSTSSPSPPANIPNGKSVYPLAGDWDGNGTETPGWFVDGTFYVSNRLDGKNTHIFSFGRSGDVPVVGDWDGDGDDTVGVVRDSTWYLRNRISGGSAHWSFSYGRVSDGDVPLVGDWDGDGDDTIGIVRNGRWHLKYALKGGASDKIFTYGRVLQGDIPLVGDWDGDGDDTPAIVRNGRWHLKYKLTGGVGDKVFTYGRVLEGDVPVVGDWAERGKTAVAIIRAGSTWHFRMTPSGGPADASYTWGP